MKDQSNTTESLSPIGECARMKDHLSTCGEFYTPQQAIDALNGYLGLPGIPARDDKHHVYGFTFGLDTIKTLIGNFDSFNTNKPLKPIAGVRLYFGNTQRHDANFPLNPVDGFFRDLFFMPVDVDGNDIFDIGFVDTNMILGGSRPCPNECGTSFLDQL